MDIFLYGTLRDPILRERLLGGSNVTAQPATLPDHVVVRQRGSSLPFLMPKVGATTDGLLLRNVTPDQHARLDAYELPFDYTLRDVSIIVSGTAATARAYFAGPSMQGSDDLWDIADWDADTGDLSREAALEIGRYDPPLTGAALKAQFPMIGRRAAARLRARATIVPTTIRYLAEPQDVEIVKHGQLHGNFFKAGTVKLRHKTFQNTTTPVLPREFFAGTDAAIVLPYDPVTDHVLLVEQMRMGPLMRGAANPWTLEPIAGMVDARESPEDAGLREAVEEAALHDLTLQKMFAFYASPGNVTDFFYCYLGLCHLPNARNYTGGLEAETEDLRLHILPFDDALAMISTGEINVGPLIAMLLWLDRNRPRLRATA